MYYTSFDTDICEIILAGDTDGLKKLHLDTGEGKRRFIINGEWERNDVFFKDTIGQIREYLAGRRTDFSIAIAAEGTAFQKAVWNELRRIPYGETRTYGEIAAKLGNKNASRAVGAANGRNPVPLIIPCHRVIGSDGKLTGFAHGLAVKQKLLEREQR